MSDEEACVALLHNLEDCGPISPWGVWFFLWSVADSHPNAGAAMTMIQRMIEGGCPIEMKDGAYQLKEAAA
ncbi:hypothetical protein [Carnimonas bestiolae]|uniref:hypothetical protein n=1 Tax=Carnimonas bestiolae TaxID=3402172 RepID=UPI003EDCA60B